MTTEGGASTFTTWHLSNEATESQPTKEIKMILGKATNLNTGAQSDEFIICADCYGSFDDAFCYANAQVNTDIAICEVADAVEGVCEQCGKD